MSWRRPGDNDLSPGRRQAIIWTNAGIWLIRTSETNFSEILTEIHAFSFKKMVFKMSSGKWRPQCVSTTVRYKINITWNIFCGTHYMNVCIVIDVKQFENTLRPRHNGRYFADKLLKWIFFHENICILIQISDNGLAPNKWQMLFERMVAWFTNAFTRHSASVVET